MCKISDIIIDIYLEHIFTFKRETYTSREMTLSAYVQELCFFLYSRFEEEGCILL